jgi:hypothetical protein
MKVTILLISECGSGQQVTVCSHFLMQQPTNPGSPVAKAIEFFTAAPNICGSSVWKFLHVTFIALEIGWLLDSWKICALLC